MRFPEAISVNLVTDDEVHCLCLRSLSAHRAFTLLHVSSCAPDRQTRGSVKSVERRHSLSENICLCIVIFLGAVTRSLAEQNGKGQRALSSSLRSGVESSSRTARQDRRAHRDHLASRTRALPPFRSVVYLYARIRSRAQRIAPVWDSHARKASDFVVRPIAAHNTRSNLHNLLAGSSRSPTTR